jgi:hypothetical protein
VSRAPTCPCVGDREQIEHAEVAVPAVDIIQKRQGSGLRQEEPGFHGRTLTQSAVMAQRAASSA